jgi:hypothetical protein
VQPGGTVEHAYSPAYPKQRQNISFGREVASVTTSFIASGATVRVFVPTNGVLGTSWLSNSFNDLSWTAGNTPASYAVGITLTPVLAFDVNERVTNAATVTEAGFTSFVINSNVSGHCARDQRRHGHRIEHRAVRLR